MIIPKLSSSDLDSINICAYISTYEQLIFKGLLFSHVYMLIKVIHMIVTLMYKRHVVGLFFRVNIINVLIINKSKGKKAVAHLIMMKL